MLCFTLHERRFTVVMDAYDRLLDRLREGSRIMIASHYNPDGDAIGSTIALGLVLERLGKRVVMYNRDAVPSNLSFLQASDRFVRKIDPEDTFDMAVMVDSASRKRISDEFAAFKGFREMACIDHHIHDEPEAAVCLIDEEAASTGEVVVRLMERAGIEADADIAQCVYTTLVVDTGFFKYSNTNAAVFRLASRMVELGARPWEVAKNIEESYPASRWMLLSRVLATLEFRLGGKYASMEVTQKMLVKSDATIDQTDEFASYPRSIEGVEVAALFRENEDGSIKVSLRSKDRVDVAAIARGFGGGGHLHASGFKLADGMKAAKKRVLDTVEKTLSVRGA